MLGISLEEFEKQAKCTNASAPADFEKRLDAKRCQHCWTLRHSHLCKGCEKLLCQHCFHYTFCGRGERGDMYHEASSISVNRGGSQANEKAVEKGDGKYDRDDVDKGPAIRQKKGANKINRLMMMNGVQSQTSTTCVPSSQGQSQPKAMCASMLAKQHVSNKNECAPGENSSPALLIDSESRTQQRHDGVRAIFRISMPPKPSRPTPW